MERTESMVVQVAPDYENARIKEMEMFGFPSMDGERSFEPGSTEHTVIQRKVGNEGWYVITVGTYRRGEDFTHRAGFIVGEGVPLPIGFLTVHTGWSNYVLL